MTTNDIKGCPHCATPVNLDLHPGGVRVHSCVECGWNLTHYPDAADSLTGDNTSDPVHRASKERAYRQALEAITKLHLDDPIIAAKAIAREALRDE